MAHYKIVSPHGKGHIGDFNGLHFTEGLAELDSDNQSHLTGGGTVQEILQRFEDAGYGVSLIKRTGLDVRESEPAAPEKPEEKSGNG